MSIGIIGNSIAIYAFNQEILLKNKFNWYFKVLAIIKLIFCTAIFTDYIFREFHRKKIFLHDLNIYTNLIFDFIVNTTDSYVTLLILIMSLDRIHAIRISKLSNMVTYLHAKALVAISIITLVFLKLSSYFFCDQFIDGTFHITICSLISPFIFNIIPTTITFGLNSILLKGMINFYRIRRYSRRNEIPNAGTSEDLLKITLINLHVLKNRSDSSVWRSSSESFLYIEKSHYFLVIISVVWSVFASLPYYLTDFYCLSFFLEIFINGYDAKTIHLAQIFSSVLLNFNHSVNFFIYFCFYSEFRYLVLTIICNFLKKFKTL